MNSMKHLKKCVNTLDGRGEAMEKQNEGLFQTKTSKEYEDAWNTIWDSIGTEDEFKSLKDIRSFIYSRPKRFPKLNADVDKFSMRLWQAYKANTDIEYETGLKVYDDEPVYTESKKSSRKRVAESYDNDTRTSVKVEFYRRDSDEVEDIVADVNELHNTTFFAHELGKKIYVESGTLFTSVAKLEDILEEFLSRGANEIRFIKA